MPFHITRRSINSLLYPVQQLIAHHIDHATYRRIAQREKETNLSPADLKGKDKAKDIKAVADKPTPIVSRPILVTELVPIFPKIEQQVYFLRLIQPLKDFFGRKIITQESEADAAKCIYFLTSVLQPTVLYRYKEGYSNAVRTKVSMDVFLKL